jgi:hypothetical protein
VTILRVLPQFYQVNAGIVATTQNGWPVDSFLLFSFFKYKYEFIKILIMAASITFGRIRVSDHLLTASPAKLHITVG